MDVKAKAQSTIVLGAHSSRNPRKSIKNSPSLYLPHYPHQHVTDHNRNRDRSRATVRQMSITAGGRRPMRESADPLEAMAGTSPRTQVRKASGSMPDSRPTRSRPDRKPARARTCDEDDSDDVFGVGIGASWEPDLEASKDKIRIQGFLNGKHREHAIAIREPHRRIRPRDNLNDIFEGMRAQKYPTRARPEAAIRNVLPSGMTKSMPAFEHYAALLISSTRAREAFVSLDERSSAAAGAESDKESSRFKNGGHCRMIRQRSMERLNAEVGKLGRSCWEEEVKASERNALAGLV